RRAQDARGARVEAAAELGLDPDLPTLLVTGGSLGAVSVNAAVAGAAQQLLDAGIQVLHLTGAGKADAVREQVHRAAVDTRDPVRAGRYQVREYLGRMELALAVADLVVARSGAGTVSELAALGLPGVYVPLPIGNGEQRLNARPVVDAGGGILVPDAEMDAHWVATRLPELLADPARREQMGRAAAEVGGTDGAARVADLVERAAAEGSGTA
ncbi:UDP-N-acetylglucosamine--N-acetylmuramyl-(pentapeptide) pyrophosphoryl-undecaprenol N-acetylglucosamine transferase, partial [Cellulomonas bogoriensis]|uniref:UDP-N-acetylglucosamine--N-acetylmuramyl- (pentapeptide) pyrophosphoryl-undecaprenol N-acetylglucosamine transferase n=1 Tax=Cellulomonas bogoriensis TaxID=301388 RepID=UPI0005580390